MDFLILFFVVVILLGFTAMTGAPYVPSRKTLVRKVFQDLYKLDKDDLLIDLGSGDGVVLKIASAEFGAKSIGIELNPILAFCSKIRLRKVKNARVLVKNFYNFKFPTETSVIYVFGDSRDIVKIYQKIQTEALRLKKDLFLISLAFEVPKYKAEKSNGAYFLYKISGNQ